MDLKKYKQIIWDWNGTLLDDTWLCVEIINTYLSDRGLPNISLSRYRNIFAFPVKDYYVTLGFDFTKESWEEISASFIAEYETKRSRCHLMPEVVETLHHLTSLGISQSILSASKQDYLERAVLEYGIVDFFSTLNGLDNHHAAGKEEIAKEYISSLEVEKSEILLIGDTLHDAHIASVIGMDCFLIPNGHHSKERLMMSGKPIIYSLLELR
jgi:phosphoglycolate phosphatase